MRHNRVLSLAITTALSAGMNLSYAGDLTIKYGGASGIVDGPPTFASEYFFNSTTSVLDGGAKDDNLDSSGMDGPAADGSYNDRFIYAIYEVTSTLTSNFIAQFTLDNGAQFGGEVDLGTDNLDFVAHPSGTHIPATLSGAFGEGGSKGDTQVSFLVQPGEGTSTFKSNGNDTLFLRFQLQKLDALTSPGEEIKMTVKLFGASGSPQVDTPAPTKVVATSKRGVNIELSAASGTAEIDVSTGSINFIRDVDGPTLAALGSLQITGVSDALTDDGTPWTFAEDPPEPASAILTVVDGNFAASLQEPGRVFLDVKDGDCSYEASTDTVVNDILADSVEADIATWNLTKDELKAIYEAPGSSSSKPTDICIQTDGQTEINAVSEAPQATFVLDYGGGYTDPYSSKMRHIKRNGSVCTLYLIPNPNAQQQANIRVTNLSGQEGKLLGTLRDPNGKAIFTNKTLVEAIAANETVRITPTVLDAVEKDPDWLTYWTADTDNNPDGLETGWSGQGVLTINSNLSNMEVYGLVRNKAGGPLTNMSVGGTGDGCD